MLIPDSTPPQYDPGTTSGVSKRPVLYIVLQNHATTISEVMCTARAVSQGTGDCLTLADE